MNTPRWERAKDIFDAALDLSSEERSNYLQQHCGDDTELRLEVEGLLAADAEAGNFMNPAWLRPFSPFAPAPEFQLVSGDVVSGRFRIVRSLGDGGMGRVYEAHDSVLGVQVALKTLRPEISANPEVLYRFRQEVRIAHRITHPNVCRTYHLDHELRRTGTDESSSVDLTFLTMEFLEGETLQQLLKRGGRLPLERALHVARQMAEAMAAAHAIGVIHRDIKPSNVMICAGNGGASDRSERVVVTDFGLAKFETRADSGDVTSISQPGRAMGTLSYMSPEQLKGGEVSVASDIYAFGLVLYEMVTGGKAFPNSGTMEAAYRRTTEAPPSAKTLVPELPASWDKAILGCLRVDPAERFQNATDVIAAIEGLHPSASSVRSGSRLTAPGSISLPKRAFAIVLLSVAGVALFAMGLRYFLTRGDAAVAPGALVYLAPVKNETGEKPLDNVTELVQAGLEQSAHINLLDAGRVGDTLQHMTRPPDTVIDETIAREIAMRNGAARVVFATITGAHGDYRLNVDIQKPDNNPTRYLGHSKKSFTWQTSMVHAQSTLLPADLLTQIRSASDWVRHEAGESADDIARLDAPPEDVTTDNWQALLEFSKGERLNAIHRRDDALMALQNAVKLDPSFALAYGRMGDLLNSMDRWTEGDEAYVKSLHADSERRLTRRERDRILGIYSLDTWDFATAESVFRDATIYYEDDSLAWFYRGAALAMLNRNQEALKCFTRAAQLRPEAASAQLSAASVELMLGNYAEATRWTTELSQHKHSDEATWIGANAKLLDGQFNASLLDLEKLESSTDSLFQSRSLDFVAHLEADRGEYREAAATLTQGIALDSASGNRAEQAQKQMDRAWIECRLHNYDLCIADQSQALADSDSFIFIRAASAVLGSALATAPASVSPKLRHALQQLGQRMPPTEAEALKKISQLQVHGEVLLADGSYQAAIEIFRKVAILDAPADPQEYLARALLLASLHTTDEAKAAALRTEAQQIYGRAVFHQAFLAYRVSFYPPGIYGDALESWLTLALKNGTPSQQIFPLLTRFSELRPTMFSRNALFQQAWRQSATSNNTFHPSF